ncbi:MAG: DUF1905 domain-containing protein [Candidatus Dojkabacteria bacterium]
MSDEFSENVTLIKSPHEMGAWHFCRIPSIYKDLSEGHGSRGIVPIIARIGNTSWETSLLGVKKDNSFIVAIKADVRKSEVLKDGDKFTLFFKFRT